jgi:addiction module HigA family antidote
MSGNIDSQRALGEHIRKEVLPRGVSVKEAAERLGVGRPALSNLLNGKAALSPDMAARLERSFGANNRELLELQDSVHRASRTGSERTLRVRRYAPSFLTIRAAQIHEWPDRNLDARQLLPVLLRRLIHTTGESLEHVDFPGYDNAQRHGWDGWIETDTATAWIPKGKSGWEFGTDDDPRAKAENDFQSRLSVPASERADCTFVFVTPRNWNSKTAWAKEKTALGAWKAVRALDASDLEQWLEESVPGQMWLAEKLGMVTRDWQILDDYWDRWTAATQPPLPAALFEPSVVNHRDSFQRWLQNPPDRPFIVSADSTGEAIAFLACLFRDDKAKQRQRDMAAVFESAQALRSLEKSAAPFIPIAATADVEKEFASRGENHNSIGFPSARSAFSAVRLLC